jgi:hypothetical protein
MMRGRRFMPTTALVLFACAGLAILAEALGLQIGYGVVEAEGGFAAKAPARHEDAAQGSIL